VRWGRVVQTTSPAAGRVRDAAIELLDRTGALDWIQQRAKPLPTFTTGAFARAPSRLPFRRTVGSLFPQPDRLDDRLGPGWAVVSRAPDASRTWRDSGLHVVHLARDAWLSHHDAEWALLRPDRYVFACGGRDALPEALHRLRDTVGTGLRTGQPAMAAAA
jgi:3-(3-hydroxy-phenyl)propionate hydroxylase